MKSIDAYLSFNGNCRQAMEFYKKCLGADLDVMLFSQAPCNTPPDQKDRVMHARLSKGDAVLMASDTMQTDPVKRATISPSAFCVKRWMRLRSSSRLSAKKAKLPCPCRTCSGALVSACSLTNSASTGCSTVNCRNDNAAFAGSRLRGARFEQASSVALSSSK